MQVVSLISASVYKKKTSDNALLTASRQAGNGSSDCHSEESNINVGGVRRQGKEEDEAGRVQQPPCGIQLMTSEEPAVSPPHAEGGWRSPAGGGGTGFPCREAPTSTESGTPTTNDQTKPDPHSEGVWWLSSADMLYIHPAFQWNGSPQIKATTCFTLIK